ncbi:hypothetical protein [Catenuloplanes japonicus]|uniref:hypothetical protein n=1 Tax=Catenuloplanes japonicus TaxID=33876 RepID=UPI00068A0266|nr:hypothetical protein [Catenuloplanes japonicus]
MPLFRRKRVPAARTLVEAELYLMLHPCACGAIDPPAASQRPEGLWFDGPCPLCGKRSTREPFGIALDAPGFGTTWETFYGGPEPSTLIDAGEWLGTAGRYASIAIPAKGVMDTQYIERITQATAQVTEYLKFIPGTGDWTEPPSSAYWTAQGRAAAKAEPTHGRLLKQAYRYGLSEDLMERGGGRFRGVRIEGTFTRPYR